MNCRDVEKRIHRVLDERGVLLEDAAIVHHTKTCRRCRTLLRKYIQLFEVLRQSEATLASCNVSNSVCQALHESGFLRPPSVPLHRRLAWLSAAATLAAVAVSLGWLWSNLPHSADTSTVTALTSAHRQAAAGPSRTIAAGASSPQPTEVVPRGERERIPREAFAQATPRRGASNQPLHNPTLHAETPHDAQPKPRSLPLEVIESVLDLSWNNVQVVTPGRSGAGASHPSLHEGLAPLASWLENAISTLADRLPFGKRSQPKEPQAQAASTVTFT